MLVRVAVVVSRRVVVAAGGASVLVSETVVELVGALTLVSVVVEETDSCVDVVAELVVGAGETVLSGAAAALAIEAVVALASDAVAPDVESLVSGSDESPTSSVSCLVEEDTPSVSLRSFLLFCLVFDFASGDALGEERLRLSSVERELSRKC